MDDTSKSQVERDTTEARRGNYKNDTLVFDADNKLDKTASETMRFKADVVQHLREQQLTKEKKANLVVAEVNRKSLTGAAARLLYTTGTLTTPEGKQYVNDLLNQANDELIRVEDLTKAVGGKLPRHQRRAKRPSKEKKEQVEEEEDGESDVKDGLEASEEEEYSPSRSSSASTMRSNGTSGFPHR